MTGDEPVADDPDDAEDGRAADDLPSSDEFPDPEPGRSPVPADAVRPLANAAVFVVAWSALLLYVGRGPVMAVGLGVAGGTIYFLAAYYVLS